MSKHDLRVDWATHAAAKYACENWHYSGCLPTGKLVKVGAWERGEFVGVVLFGRGANNRMSAAYGLRQDEAAELVRIALRDHRAPVSRIKAIALRFLKQQSGGVRLVVSYADPDEGHHGGIYQAGNWIYAGRSQAQKELVVGGVFTHKRSANATWGTASPEKIAKLTGKKVEWGPVQWKHIYLMPLDPEMRDRVLPLSKPYPKPEQASEGEESSRPATSGEEGGASPTPALQDGR